MSLPLLTGLWFACVTFTYSEYLKVYFPNKQCPLTTQVNDPLERIPMYAPMDRL